MLRRRCSSFPDVHIFSFSLLFCLHPIGFALCSLSDTISNSRVYNDTHTRAFELKVSFRRCAICDVPHVFELPKCLCCS